MAKQRYELVEGSSSKFWEIEPRGTDVAIAWGKIGTAGQSQTKSFADEASAAAAAAKLIKEKTSKGYALVSAEASAGDTPKASAGTAKASAGTAKASAGAAKASEGTPKASEGTPKASEGTPKASEGTPKASEDTPKASDDTPKASDDTPKASDDTPKASDDTPKASDDTPKASEDTPKALEASAGSVSAQGFVADAIVWTPELERLREEATREVAPATLPADDDATLLATVRAWLDANPFTTPTAGYEHFRNRKNLTLGRGLADADGARAFDRLLDYADGKLPATFEPEIDGGVIALVMGREARRALVSLLLRHTGATQTFDALCAVFLYEHGSQNGDREAFPNWVMRLSDPSHAKGTFGSEPELASLLAQVPEARAELEARAEAKRQDGSLALRIALALTFRRRDWAAADAQRLLTSPTPVTSGYYVASMLEDELVSLAKVRSGHHAPYRPDAIATVARLGFGALPYLAFLADDTSADFTRVAQALSVLEHPRAAASLATFLEKKGYSSPATQKEHAAIVQRYFARRPDLAVRVLGPIVAGRSKLATKVEPIVKAALRSSPSLLASVGGALEPRVREHLAGFVESPVAAAAPARADDVPRVLREPPWTRAADAIPTLSLEIMGPYAPLYADFTGTVEPPTHYYFPSTAPVPAGVEPRTEAFDAFVRERLPSLSDWDRGSLLEGCTRGYVKELFEAHGSEHFKRSAEAFYFRLGNEVWPLVLAEVRDRPGWAIDFGRECAEPRLARAFAQAFETKSHRTRATEWLRRFPEAASRGLVPLVLGPPSKARDAGRRALRALLASLAEVVRSVAAGDGDEAAKALARLEASPPDVYPKKLPSLPSFLDLSVLPPLVLN
ncbi:MAG: WGR domain-containing protein, partial [Sandaracinaceae bacterium]|nr:WGR domain-containing protein [Sandaracinaceae bacterium]